MSNDIMLDFQSTQSMLTTEIKNMSLEQLQRARRDLTTLYRTASEISSLLNVKEIYYKCLEKILVEMKAVDCCSIHIVREDGQLDCAGTMARKSGEDLSYKFSSQMLELVIKEKKGILTHDAQADDRLDGSRSIMAMQIHSAICVPLCSRKRIFGVIQASNLRPLQKLTKDDLALLSGIGALVGGAVESAELFEKLQMERDRLAETNEKLQIAQEGLIRSEKMSAIGQLTAGIVHDVKNPLHVVIGYTELLKISLDELPEKEIDGVNLPDCISEIEKGAIHCNEIISQLLQFSRQSPPEKQEIQINDLVRELIEFMAYELRPYSIQNGYAENLPPVKVDANQIKQTLMNIILNGIQAMDKGGEMMIATATEQNEDGKEYICTYVKDSGCGMTEEIKRKIFDPFFTTKQASTESTGGTGLGLSTCYGIIEAHGGKIEIDSEPGKGSTFCIKLPVKR